MSLKSNNVLTYTPLVLILLLASFFRLYGLAQQGPILFDEASFQIRALEIHKIISSKASYSPSYLYVDSKILWLSFLLLAQTVFGQSFIVAQLVSFVFALATILLTYALAKKMYQSHDIGLLSAFFLSVSSYHVFYSRLAVSESATIFFSLLSVYVYLIATSKKRLVLAGVAGFATGCGFLLDRFRVGLVPCFVMIIELYENRLKKSGYIASLKRFFVYSVCLLLTISLGAFLLYYVLNALGVATPNYGEGLNRHLALHQWHGVDWSAFLSYPYFIVLMEGGSYYILLICSLAFITHQRSTLLPILFCVLQIIVASLMDERGARSIVAILPFLAIICAITSFNLFETSKIKKYKRVVCVLLIVIAVMPSLINTRKLITFKSGMKKAADFILNEDATAGVISSSMYYTQLYMPGTAVTQIYQEDLKDLKNLLTRGYRYLLLDPEQYVMNTLDGVWNKTELTPVLSALTTNCSPLREISHFNAEVHRRFVFEHNRNFMQTLKMLNHLNARSGNIYIYDLSMCLPKLGSEHVIQE